MASWREKAKVHSLEPRWEKGRVRLKEGWGNWWETVRVQGLVRRWVNSWGDWENCLALGRVH